MFAPEKALLGNSGGGSLFPKIREKNPLKGRGYAELLLLWASERKGGNGLGWQGIHGCRTRGAE